MKKRDITSNLKKVSSIGKTPVGIVFSILLVAIGLFWGLYSAIQDNFSKLLLTMR